EEAIGRIEDAARDCSAAAGAGDVSAELAANRRFHFALFDSPDQPHLLRLLGLLWESTEAYRALYYNSAAERDAAVAAHDRVVTALRRGHLEELISELDDHRTRALEFLREVLAGADADGS